MNKPTSYTTDETVAAIRTKSGASNDYRALVCVFLFGGNDSHNMIIPRNGTPNRLPYDTERGILAVTDSAPNLELSTDWRLHPNLGDLKTLYDQGDLAVLMNAGYLKAPTNRTSYLAKSVPLPPQLFSHNNQQQLWQALPPFAGLAVNGWMGRAADLVDSYYNPNPTDGVSSLFSIAGRQTQMQGWDVTSSDMNTSGPQTVGAGDGRSAPGFNAALISSRSRQDWDNVLQKTLAERMAAAVSGQAALAAQLQALPTIPNDRFNTLSANSLAQQLRVVARIIHSRSNYSHRRDVFFVSLGGWDDHDALTTAYGPRMQLLDDALFGFWNALGDLGMQQNVVTFTESEFGRALKANNNGSDHGWGGHHIIMGGSVRGGQIFGTPPNLANGSINDAGQGRMIPTTSVEQYAGTLLKWWGVPESTLPVVLENIEKFSPQTLDMLDEPVPVVATPPALSLNFMNGVLDPRIAFTRGSLATQFDKSGNMVVTPVNLASNSAMIGVSKGVYVTGQGPLPALWRVDNAAPIKHEIVNFGALETGEKFIDVRFFGTNNTAGNLFPGIRPFQDAGAAIRLNERVVWSVKACVVGDPLGSPTVALAANSTLAGAYVGNLSSLGATADRTLVLTEKTLRRLFGVFKMPSSGADGARFAITMTVPAYTAVDVTIRLAEPQVEYSLNPIDTQAVPGPYLETTDSGPNFGPRFDYDPVTLNPRGLLCEAGRTNLLTDTVFSGFVPGTPGTFVPATLSAGFSTTTGMSFSLVRKGIESGIPFIDVRVFGTAVGSGSLNLTGPATPVAFTAAQNPGPRYTFSAYLSLKSGRIENGSFARVFGRVDGTYNSEVQGTPFGATLKNLPLSHQRVQSTMQMSLATLNGTNGGIGFTLVDGVTYDFTIRIGAPQFEQGEQASSFIPCIGGNTARNSDSAIISGTNFTSVFNASAGTFVNKFSHAANSLTPFIHYPEPFSANSGGQTNRVSGYVVSNNSRAGADVTSGGVSQANIAVTAPLANFGVDGTLAVGYALNNVNVAYKGALGTLDTAATLPVGINRLQIGGSITAWVKSLDYYNVRLTDAQLTLLSST